MNYVTAEILTKGDVKIVNCLPEIGIDNVNGEILEGLLATEKYISSKFFYDKVGSQLFEDITHLNEYYPTRTEKSILKSLMHNFQYDFSDVQIIELGSGDHSKIRLLLRQIPSYMRAKTKYCPVDISQSAIEGSSDKLIAEFPELTIHGVVADFIHQLDQIPNEGKRLFCFFGSTIGNLTSDEAKVFMKNLGKVMKRGDGLLLGMDMVKDLSVLNAAYNDREGVTAKFNKNILNVLNNLVGTNFDISNFEHYAYFNANRNRIEMHLKALCDMEILVVDSDECIKILKGETIHTENSHKYTKESILETASWANLTVQQIFTDPKEWFSLAYFRK